MLDKARLAYKFKKQQDELKRRMAAIVVEVEEKGVKIVMQGDQEVQEVLVDGERDERLEKAFNKAVKESQKKVAKKMRDQLQDLGLPF